MQKSLSMNFASSDAPLNTMLASSFQIAVAETFERNCVACGRFFGKTSCLAFATGAGFVSIMDGTSGGHQRLNLDVHLSVRYLFACPFGDGARDVLVMGHAESVQCYDPLENKQLFYTTVESTVESLVVVPAAAKDQTCTILAGGMCTIQGFNLEGREVLWMLVSSRVTSLGSLVSASGPPSFLAATDNQEIMCVSLNDEMSKRWTVQEADVVEFLVGTGGALLGYGLRNGTLGVYQNSARLWRVKSKHALHSLVALDPYSDGQLRLVSGWSNGKVEIRKALTGEMLFRESCSAAVVAVFAADLRNSGANDVVVCDAQGGIRGFHPVASLPESVQAQHNLEAKENTLARLNQRAKELRFELETLDATYHQSLRKSNKESVGGSELIQKDDLVCALRADLRSECLVLTVDGRNKNCRFKGAVALGENLFQSESCFVAYSTAQHQLEIRFSPPKDVASEMLLQIFIKHQSATTFQTLEIHQRVPKFLMYADISHSIEKQGLALPESHASMVLNANLPKVWSWLCESFSLEDSALPPSNASRTVAFQCMRLNRLLAITLECDQNHLKVSVRCENVELVGTILQDLCQSLNIANLAPTIHFPSAMNELDAALKQLQQFDAGSMKPAVNVARRLPLLKSLVVQSEDARCLRDIASFKQCMSEMYALNQEMAMEQEDRMQQQKLYMETLQAASRHLQAIANLYRGTIRDKILQDCRECMKSRRTDAILSILQHCSQSSLKE